MRHVAPGDWLAEWTVTHSRGLDFLDFLTAVDRVDTIEVVAHALDPSTKEHLIMATTVSAEVRCVDSLSGVYPGASWHERETAEMFGVRFEGLADTRPLLLRTAIGAPPMLKSTVLAARLAVDWPGGSEPGGSPVRRRQRPPGVADDWLEDRS